MTPTRKPPSGGGKGLPLVEVNSSGNRRVKRETFVLKIHDGYGDREEVHEVGRPCLITIPLEAELYGHHIYEVLKIEVQT